MLKKKWLKRLLVVIVITAILIWVAISNQSYLFTKLVGGNEIKKLSHQEICELSKDYGINENIHFVDSSYKSYIFSYSDDTLKSHSIKNHLQPLQLMYFDSSGKMIAHYINCYCGGLPNLNWTKNGNLESFPPQHQKYDSLSLEPDTLINLQSLKKMVKHSSFCSPHIDSSQVPAKYTVAIFWSNMMGRQSSIMIEEARKNLALAKNPEDIEVIYINNDNYLFSAFN